MTDDAIPPDEVLPCGCIMRCAIIDGERTLTYVPCRLNCVNLRNALQLADDGDVDVSFEKAP